MTCQHCYHPSLLHEARPGFQAAQCCLCAEVKEIKLGQWRPKKHAEKKGAEA